MTDRELAVDAHRELLKSLDVLAQVARHLNAVAEANAGLHLSDKVHPNPLTAAVNTVLHQTGTAARRIGRSLEMGEDPLPFDES